MYTSRFYDRRRDYEVALARRRNNPHEYTSSAEQSDAEVSGTQSGPSRGQRPLYPCEQPGCDACFARRSDSLRHFRDNHKGAYRQKMHARNLEKEESGSGPEEDSNWKEDQGYRSALQTAPLSAQTGPVLLGSSARGLGQGEVHHDQDLPPSPIQQGYVPRGSSVQGPRQEDLQHRDDSDNVSYGPGMHPADRYPTDGGSTPHSEHIPPICFQHISSLLAELFATEPSLACQDCASNPENSINHHTVSFHVDWDLIGFLQSEYGNLTTGVRDVITIGGSALCAYATSCSEYLRRFWPRSSEPLLNELQYAIDCYRTGDYSALPATVERLRVHIPSSIVAADRFAAGSIYVRAHGDFQELNDVAQQLCWLGAAMRTHRGDYSPVYSEALFQSSALQRRAVFDISFTVQKIPPLEEAPCWFPLFRNAVIAHAFEVPRREHEIGLEIPIPIMAALGGVQHAVEYEGGVVLKGLSLAFVPLKIMDDIVQWHLVEAERSDVRLSYSSAVKRYPGRLLAGELSLESLSSTRAIVGWCKEATLNLGIETACYDALDHSGCERAHRELRFTSVQFGVSEHFTFQAAVQLSRRAGYFPERGGTFKHLLALAERTPAVLYDTSEKRGWLVPISEVLHITQNRIFRDRQEPGGKKFALLQTDGKRSSARDILNKYAATKLMNDTVEHMVQQWWSILEGILDKEEAEKNSPGVLIKRPNRAVGYELCDVRDLTRPCQAKYFDVQYSSGDWLSLASAAPALVLLASGLGDVILPSGDLAGLCSVYRRLPKGAGYLGTTVKVLEGLFRGPRVRGEPSSKLTNAGLKLDCTDSKLFDTCGAPESCHCSRLQSVRNGKKCRRFVTQTDLTRGKAIIIGRRLKNNIRNCLTRHEEVRNRSSEDNSLRPAVYGPDSNSPVYGSEFHTSRTESSTTLRSSGTAQEFYTPRSGLSMSLISYGELLELTRERP